jgi:hypothetical protein
MAAQLTKLRETPTEARYFLGDITAWKKPGDACLIVAEQSVFGSFEGNIGFLDVDEVPQSNISPIPATPPTLVHVPSSNPMPNVFVSPMLSLLPNPFLLTPENLLTSIRAACRCVCHSLTSPPMTSRSGKLYSSFMTRWYPRRRGTSVSLRQVNMDSDTRAPCSMASSPGGRSGAVTLRKGTERAGSPSTARNLQVRPKMFV